jgi:hypothetical protein
VYTDGVVRKNEKERKRKREEGKKRKERKQSCEIAVRSLCLNVSLSAVVNNYTEI